MPEGEEKTVFQKLEEDGYKAEDIRNEWKNGLEALEGGWRRRGALRRGGADMPTDAGICEERPIGYRNTAELPGPRRAEARRALQTCP